MPQVQIVSLPVRGPPGAVCRHREAVLPEAHLPEDPKDVYIGRRQHFT